MTIRLAEIVSVFALVAALIVAKYVPLVNQLPLSALAGIVCFAFSIFLALKLFQSELQKIRNEG